MQDSLYTARFQQSDCQAVRRRWQACSAMRWLEIDTSALVKNLSCVTRLSPGASMIAMVKADAYGHGLLPVARALSLPWGKHSRQVDALGVACFSSAITLREAGITLPIILMSGLHERALWEMACALQVDVVLHNREQVQYVLAHTHASTLWERRRQWRSRVWLKVETGMHRLGLPTAIVPDVLSQLVAAGVPVQGLMTHFATANQRNHALYTTQQARFFSLYRRLKKHIPHLAYSYANSAVLLSALSEKQEEIEKTIPLSTPLTEKVGEWVRPGLLLYGLTPPLSPSVLLPPSLLFSPVMSLYARIISIKTLQKGDSVGYGAHWTASTPTRIGIVAIGYGDGYPPTYSPGASVWVKNQACPLIGTVFMDMLTIDLSACPQVACGDVAMLWGPHWSLDRVAHDAGCSSYTLLCGVGRVPRLPRVYR